MVQFLDFLKITEEGAGTLAVRYGEYGSSIWSRDRRLMTLTTTPNAADRRAREAAPTAEQSASTWYMRSQ